MPDVLIRDVDAAVLEGLKERAKNNEHSLQAELKAILTAATKKPPVLDAIELAKKIRCKLSEHTESVGLLKETRVNR